MKIKKILAMATVLAITTSYFPSMYAGAIENDAIPMDSLKGYWTFENVEGDNIIDDSNNGKDATLKGNASIIDGGKNNKGLKLTGEKGTFLSIPSIFNLAQENVSLSFWVNISPESENNRSGHTILLQQEGDGKSILYYAASSSGDKLGSFVSGSDSFSNEKLTQDKWINVAMVSDYSKKEIKFYINGKLDSTHLLSSLSNSNDPLRLGDHKNNNGLALNGIVDEVMIFGDCLTDEQILNIYYENADISILKDELLSAINVAYETYNLAVDFLSGDLIDKFLSEINKAEELIKSDIEDIKVFVEEIEELNDLNVKVNEALSNKIGDDILVKADINDVFREIGRSLFGANHRYHKDGYGSYDTENLKVKEEFDELYKESNFGAIRYPGGKVANLFEWKKSIGDIDERKYTIHGDPEQEPEFPYFGVDEVAKYAEENNSELAYVYNMGNGNKLDAADLVEYLNCEVGENPNGGIDWAEVRAENGRVEPYNVTHFELGNEFQLLSEQAYWTTASNDPMGAYIDGGEFQFNNQFVVEYEDWRNSTAGRSNGKANQEKIIRYYPIVEDTLVLTVGGQTWQQVESLEGQGASNVFVYDNESGRINFGDGINGNIPAEGKEIKVSYKAHRDGYVDYYEEMKKVDPDIKIYSCYDSENFITRMGTEKSYDGIVTHPYSGTISSSDANYYEKILYRAEEKVNVAQNYENKIKEVLGEEKAKDVSVVVSEYGIFNDSSRFVKSQINALYTAKSIIGFADIESIPYATKHCLVDFPGGDLLGPGGQAIIQSIYNENGEIEFVATPSAKVFTLFNNMTGNYVLNEKVINNKTVYGNLEALDTMITKDDEGNLYLMLVNAAKEEVSVNINVDGFDFRGKTGEGMLVDGPSFDAENTIDNKDNVVVEEFVVETIKTSNFQYTLTPHSVTAIKINAKASEVEFTSHLEIAVELANEVTEEELSKVVPAVANEFREALEEAKNVLANEASTQTEIDEAFEILSNAMQMLEFIKGDKTQLINLLDRINGLNSDEYIQSTWTNLQTVVEKANGIVADENALEAEVAESYKEVLRGFLELRLKPSKDKLEDLINKVEILDASQYTASSWSNLQETLGKARAVFENEEATSTDISKVEKELQGAIDNLVANESTGNGGNTNTGNGNNNESANTGSDNVASGTTTNSESNNVAASTSGNSTNKTSSKGQLPNTGDLGGIAALFMGATSLAAGCLGLKKRR